MHRKSLEAAEHIRKQDEKDLINGERSLSPIGSSVMDSSDDSNLAPSTPPPQSILCSTQKLSTQTTYSPSTENLDSSTRKELVEQDKSKKRDDMKSESVANLRAKAKEHSAKIMENITSNESSKNFYENKLTDSDSDGKQCTVGYSDSSNSSIIA